MPRLQAGIHVETDGVEIRGLSDTPEAISAAGAGASELRPYPWTSE